MPFLWGLMVTATYFVAEASTFYSCLYWLIPRFLMTRRYIAFAGSLLVVFIAATSLTTFCLMPALQYIFNEQAPGTRSMLLYNTLANFYTLCLLIAVKSIKNKIQTDRKTQLNEKMRTENELRFLRSQLNPHFLFNAINSIYILIRKDPQAASGTLARFADMLRYQLYECKTEEIPVEKEVAYLNNYIEMEKLRKGNMVTTYYQVDEQVNRFSIVPLILIPFVENAFKHVSTFTDKDNQIDITLTFSPPLFKLHVANTVDDTITGMEDKTYSGIGLENVKRRLELLYHGRHQLRITNTGSKYEVLLSIQIA
ncbi:sensor histidine kinase [Niastella yeongjuensis]|nr:histidine kinase [Niastella yeongjuensis]